MQTPFEALEPECLADVNVTSFRYQHKNYTISTVSLGSLKDVQRVLDVGAGYTGETGDYETMLFLNGESLVYPFGDLPGNVHLGVFQRYNTIDAARDGHQQFVTRVQRLLLEREVEK